MFLELIGDDIKYDFMELAVKTAKANGIIEESEKELLEMLSKEMDIPMNYSSDKDIDDVIQRLVSNSSEMERRIILFELVGIVLSDECVQNEEKVFLQNLSKKLCISEKKLDTYLYFLKEYSHLYKNIYRSVINGDDNIV